MQHDTRTSFELVRIGSASDVALPEVWKLYEVSFPWEERRSWHQHRKAMEEPSFACLALRDGRGLAGLLLVWETDAFVFLEHLAVEPARRGRGVGHAALDLLHRRAGKRPVILEIEPVVDVMTQRRRRFYESCGYVMLPYPHEQLPFHPGERPLPLALMSFPRAMTEAEVEAFEVFLREHIMRYRDR